jgi:hypothetical protein
MEKRGLTMTKRDLGGNLWNLNDLRTQRKYEITGILLDFLI